MGTEVISLDFLINILTILALLCMWAIAGGIALLVTGRLLKKCLRTGLNFVLRDR